MDLHAEPAAADAWEAFFFHHFHCPPGDFFVVLEDSTGKFPGKQLAVVGIAAVRKGLQGQPDALLSASFPEFVRFTRGQGEKYGLPKLSRRTRAIFMRSSSSVTR